MTRPGFPRTRRLRQRGWQGEPANGVRRWLTGALAATIVFLLLIAAITDLRGQGVEGCRNDAGWISCESQLAEGGAA